jgi:hypothetical protein
MSEKISPIPGTDKRILRDALSWHLAWARIEKLRGVTCAMFQASKKIFALKAT